MDEGTSNYQSGRTEGDLDSGSDDADDISINGDGVTDNAAMTILELEYVPVEVTAEEIAERDLVNRFLCDCKQADGAKPCSSLFSVDTMLNLRNESRAIDYYENHTNKLDLVVLGILRALVSTGQTTKSKKKKPRERQRYRTTFLLQGQRVCEKTFLFAHAISEKRYKRLTSVFKHNGMVELQHGNTNRVSVKSLGHETTSRVVSFIRDYANDNALFVPGRNGYPKTLPMSATKSKVYELYKQACENESVQYASLVSFRKLWTKHCPEVVIQKPKPGANASGKEPTVPDGGT